MPHPDGAHGEGGEVGVRLQHAVREARLARAWGAAGRRINMAHADYNCCAVCDCKLDYAGWNATTKERICEDCLLKLQEMNLKIVTVRQLIAWIKDTDNDVLREKLKEMGYRCCYYENDVDTAIKEKRIEFNENGRVL